MLSFNLKGGNARLPPCGRPRSEAMTTFFEKFQQNAQNLKPRVSVSNFKSRGFDEVSVSVS